jgi:hypothetical protein
MARFPNASWRPLSPDWTKRPKMARYDLVILHTMVGSLSGTDGMFHRNGFAGSHSHFGVGRAGQVIQWQDTMFRSSASGTANSRSISIETADMGEGFEKWNTQDGNAVPAWTEEQVEALAQLCAWASTQCGIPLVPVTDSKPGRRGIAYHRLGVPGTKGALQSVTGGELWSSATGKVCPGPRRIAQVPRIIQRALQIRDGGGKAVARQDPQLQLPFEEDTMLIDVPLFVAGDGSFRTTKMVESHSALAGDAYILLGSTWGAARFDVTALRADGVPIYSWHPEVANNCQWNQQLPPETRMITIEGIVEHAPRVDDRGTSPAAMLGMTSPK